MCFILLEAVRLCRQDMQTSFCNCKTELTHVEVNTCSRITLSITIGFTLWPWLDSFWLFDTRMLNLNRCIFICLGSVVLCYALECSQNIPDYHSFEGKRRGERLQMTFFAHQSGPTLFERHVVAEECSQQSGRKGWGVKYVEIQKRCLIANANKNTTQFSLIPFLMFSPLQIAPLVQSCSLNSAWWCVNSDWLSMSP